MQSIPSVDDPQEWNRTAGYYCEPQVGKECYDYRPGRSPVANNMAGPTGGPGLEDDLVPPSCLPGESWAPLLRLTRQALQALPSISACRMMCSIAFQLLGALHVTAAFTSGKSLKAAAWLLLLLVIQRPLAPWDEPPECCWRRSGDLWTCDRTRSQSCWTTPPSRAPKCHPRSSALSATAGGTPSQC